MGPERGTIHQSNDGSGDVTGGSIGPSPLDARERICFDIEELGTEVHNRTLNPFPIGVGFFVWMLTYLILDMERALLLGLGLAVYLIWTRSSRIIRGVLGPVVQSSPEELKSARLVAVGNSKVLSRLTLIRDEPFEPIFIDVWFPDRTWKRLLPVYLVIFAIIASGLWLISPENVVLTIQISFIGLGCSLWLMSRLRPTIYRIVPGRLDIMKGRALTSRLETKARFELRSPRIQLDPVKQAIEIKWADGRVERLTYSAVSEPMRFIEAVFKAAICTAATPPLPEDALLG